MPIVQRANDILEKVIESAPKSTPAIATAVVSIVVAAALYRRRQLANSVPPGYKSAKDIPYPPGLPLIGNIHQLGLKQILERLENWAWEFGPVYKFYVGPSQVIVFSSVEAIDQFFKERPFNIRRIAKTEKLFEDCNIPGLFSMEGEKWRHSRNWMAPQLTHTKINKASPVVAKHVVTLRNALKEKSNKMEDVNQKWFPDLHQAALSENCPTTVHYNPNDVTNDITCLREYAFSIMLDFAFAHDNNNHMPPTLFNDLKIIFQVIRRRSLYPIPVYKYGIRDSMDRKYDQVIGELRSSIKRIIEEYDPEQYKQNSSRMSTMLESLWIAAQDEETQSAASGMATARKAAKRVTIDDVIGNLITAIVAGYDTTSNTLNAISYLLSCNPEAQKKLQEEADSILGTPENRSEMAAGELTNLLDEDFVKQFPYANAVIQETNRLLPVASLLDGQLTKDLVIDGYYLKKKTTLLVMTRVAGLRSCPTPDPFKFKPERWLDCTPEERRQHDKMAWGFGGGPRICPGRHLASMELVAALVVGFSLFDIKPIERPFSAPKPREGSEMSAVLENNHLRFIPRYTQTI